MAPRDLPQLLDHHQRGRELRVLELRHPPAMVAGRQGDQPLVAEPARQQPPLHGAVDDHSDLVLSAVAEDLRLDLPVQHAVGRLQRGDGVDLADPLHLPDTVVGHAEISHLALLGQPGHLLPRLLDIGLRVGPVHLVEVDGLDAEPFEAVFTFLSDALPLEVRHLLPLVVPEQAALGGDVRLMPGHLERLAYQLLGVAKTIDRGRIDPVDPLIQPGQNRGDGVIVVLRPPPILPRPAHGPRAKAHRRQVQVSIPKSSHLHTCIPRQVLDSPAIGYNSRRNRSTPALGDCHRTTEPGTIVSFPFLFH